MPQTTKRLRRVRRSEQPPPEPARSPRKKAPRAPIREEIVVTNERDQRRER